MPLHLADGDCLRPRLPDESPAGPGAPSASDGPPRRVLGLLHRAGESGAPRLVDAIDFDGTRCRYRTIGRGDEPTRWFDARPDDDYRPCARIVVERLRTLRRDRPAADPVADGSATDAVVTPDGRVRVELRDANARSTRWIDA